MELFQELGEMGMSVRPSDGAKQIISNYSLLDQNIIGRILEENNIVEIGKDYIKIQFSIERYIEKFSGVKDGDTWFIPFDEYHTLGNGDTSVSDLVMTLVEWGYVHINRNRQIEFKLVEDE